MSGEDLVRATILAAGSMAGDLISTVFQPTTQDNIGFHFIFTGTPTGAFFVDISVDDPANNNWVTLPISPAPVASGAAASVYAEINQTTAWYMRARYTRTSGTGTLKIMISEKMV